MKYSKTGYKYARAQRSLGQGDTVHVEKQEKQPLHLCRRSSEASEPQKEAQASKKKRKEKRNKKRERERGTKQQKKERVLACRCALLIVVVEATDERCTGGGVGVD